MTGQKDVAAITGGKHGKTGFLEALGLGDLETAEKRLRELDTRIKTVKTNFEKEANP
jgi:hypothetical protein